MPTLAWPMVYLYPPLAAVGLWVGLTAAIAALNRRGVRPARLALLASLPLLLLAHHELLAIKADLSVTGAYRGFVAGTLIWAWHELAFYSGVITGPWRQCCPSGARGFFRFAYALRTHLHHEAAVLIELAVMLWLLHDARNLVGPVVFVLSWALQHSAKLNVLLGVPSLDVELFPQHLRYLGSFWARRPPSGLFLPSASAITLLACMLWAGVHAEQAGPAGVRLALVASLITLGALEHWLLILPHPATAPAGSLVE